METASFFSATDKQHRSMLNICVWAAVPQIAHLLQQESAEEKY